MTGPRLLFPMLLLLILPVLLSLPGIAPSGTANAADKASRETSAFDRPVAVQRVPFRHVAARPEQDPAGEIRCTYYPDLMIRETGIDTPAPGAASVVPVAAGSQRPPCTADPAAGETKLNTASHSFAGRKGPFLFFSATDPTGAIPFVVLDAVGGQVIYRDGTTNGVFTSVTLKGNAVRLRYRHGVNGSCSVYKEGPACWAKLLNEGKVPHALAQAQPFIPVCAASYGKAKVTSEDPSVISYDVDVTLQRSGKMRVNSRGTVGCDPMP